MLLLLKMRCRFASNFYIDVFLGGPYQICLNQGSIPIQNGIIGDFVHFFANS